MSESRDGVTICEHGYTLNEDCAICDQLFEETVVSATNSPSPTGEAPRCADCGAAMNAGEASVFTVCDGCWRAHYDKLNSPSSVLTGEGEEEVAERLFYLWADAVRSLQRPGSDFDSRKAEQASWSRIKEFITDLRSQLSAALQELAAARERVKELEGALTDVRNVIDAKPPHIGFALRVIDAARQASPTVPPGAPDVPALDYVLKELQHVGIEYEDGYWTCAAEPEPAGPFDSLTEAIDCYARIVSTPSPPGAPINAE